MVYALLLSALMLAQPAHADRFSDPTAEEKVDQIVSIFENSTPVIQYGYIEALKDGRGYTAGRAGFTTATGDLVEVVHHYSDMNPTVPSWPGLQALIPRLEELRDQESSSLRGLADLPDLWRSSADDPKFRQAQDDVTESMYKNPARALCQKLGLKTALGFLVIYDSIIQHGNGSDDDSLPSLLKRTHADPSNEDAFIRAFLEVRRADLLNPADPDTADEWRESVDRVDALKALVETGNWELHSPLRLEVGDDTYAL